MISTPEEGEAQGGALKSLWGNIKETVQEHWQDVAAKNRRFINNHALTRLRQSREMAPLRRAPPSALKKLLLVAYYNAGAKHVSAVITKSKDRPSRPNTRLLTTGKIKNQEGGEEFTAEAIEINLVEQILKDALFGQEKEEIERIRGEATNFMETSWQEIIKSKDIAGMEEKELQQLKEKLAGALAAQRDKILGEKAAPPATEKKIALKV